MLTPQKPFGRYLIRRRIGRGGMAEVYEAVIQADAQHSKRLALKVLRRVHRDHQQIISSFIDEARMAARLSHPNVVEVFDFGEVDGELYMAMEYLDGMDLRQLTQLAARRGAALPVAAAVFVSYELALALDYIHNVDPPIVHRDVTPHNVFITGDGHVKLGDFGVAKSALRLVQTESGQIMGKLSYLAPEQLSEDPVTSRTDVYAAGLVLFELLTGRRLLDGASDVDVLRLAMNPPAVAPSSINPEAGPLDRLVASALQRHPAMRLPSAEVMASRLQELLARMPFDAAAMAELAEGLRDQDRTSIFMGPAAEPTASQTTPDDTADTMTTPVSAMPARAPTEAHADGTRRLEGAHRPPPARRGAWLMAGLAALVLAGAGAGAWWFVTRGLTRRAPPPDASATGDRDSAAATPDDLGPDLPDTAADLPDTAADLPDTADLRPPDTAARRSVPARGAPRPRRPWRRPRPKRPPPAPARRPAASPPAAHPRPAAALEARRGRLRRLTRDAASRGLYPGDSAAYARKLAAAQKALSADTGDAALDALERHINAFSADRRFVERKLARLEGAIERARLSDAQRRQLSASTREILKQVMSNRLVQASRLITEQMKRLATKRR